MQAKYVLAIIDGMTNSSADTFEDTFSNNELSRLFQLSNYGWLNTTPVGFETDSINCISTLLGISHDKLPKGRAYFECIASGISVGENDLIFRCNPSLFSSGILVSANCYGLSEDEYAEASSLFEKYSSNVVMHHMHTYKNVLVLKDQADSLEEVRTFPPHQNIGKYIGSILPFGGEAGNILRSFVIESQSVLTDRFGKEMAMIPWGESIYSTFPSFNDLFSLHGAAVCETEIVKGIAMQMGLSVIHVEGATGDTDTDLDGKANAAIQALKTNDFVFVHVNGADEAAHRLDKLGKEKFIQNVAERLIIPIADSLETGSRLMATSDHATNPETGSHIGSPQPFVIYEKGKSDHNFIGTLDGKQCIGALMDVRL